MRFQSLQVRLAVRLAVLYVAATAVAGEVLIYQADDTAASLHDRELSLRADDLARAVSRDGTGLPQLKLPAKLATGYATSSDDIFAVRAGFSPRLRRSLAIRSSDGRWRTMIRVTFT